ncbi:unnamed protein product [Allacma fusca]|uniref:Uncharacterized protein n=1 Tax=Allacma fusca TaxID=39272 RepID=A0A8J2LEI5_9HEXA|nr:unnamed protein product [Allacma fusca]
MQLYRTGETGAPLVMVPAPGKFYDELSDDWSEIELVPLQKFYSDEKKVIRMKYYWKAEFKLEAQDVGESDWKWDRRNRGRQKVRSERYKTFVKAWQNKVNLEKYEVSDSGGTPDKKNRRIARDRVIEFLTYGDVNVTTEQIQAKDAEQSRLEFVSKLI